MDIWKDTSQDITPLRSAPQKGSYTLDKVWEKGTELPSPPWHTSTCSEIQKFSKLCLLGGFWYPHPVGMVDYVIGECLNFQLLCLPWVRWKAEHFYPSKTWLFPLATSLTPEAFQEHVKSGLRKTKDPPIIQEVSQDLEALPQKRRSKTK